jgi:hypothetical protein
VYFPASRTPPHDGSPGRAGTSPSTRLACIRRKAKRSVRAEG